MSLHKVLTLQLRPQMEFESKTAWSAMPQKTRVCGSGLRKSLNSHKGRASLPNASGPIIRSGLTKHTTSGKDVRCFAAIGMLVFHDGVSSHMYLLVSHVFEIESYFDGAHDSTGVCV